MIQGKLVGSTALILGKSSPYARNDLFLKPFNIFPLPKTKAFYDKLSNIESQLSIYIQLQRNLPINSFKVADCADNSSLVAEDSCADTELFCITSEICSIPCSISSKDSA